MYTLRMWDNLNGLIDFKEIKSIEDIRALKQQKKLPEKMKKNEKRWNKKYKEKIEKKCKEWNIRENL